MMIVKTIAIVTGADMKKRKSIFKKMQNIYEGWSKALELVKVGEENKKLAKARVEICIECPHAEEHWLKKIVAGSLQVDKVGSGIGCSLCGCPVNEKALVIDEQCPISKW